MPCPNCGHENQPGSSFCSGCGAKVKRSSSGGERRQLLTVMFCDLVGSTGLAERLDPEDLRELYRSYQDVVCDVITRFDGSVVQYLGDGVVVQFGYPVSHEDDARRAVSAAFAILSEMRGMNETHELEGLPRVDARIGLHTGLSLVAEVGPTHGIKTMLPVGETPNVAARLQAIAEPNEVVISETTQRLTQGFFRTESLGPQSLKGLSRTLEVHRVIGETGARTRMDAAAAAGFTRFVGREDELGQLFNAWRLARGGQQGVVLIVGDAGIGKSRLVYRVKDAVGSEAYWFSCQCSEYHQTSPLFPLRQPLNLLLRCGPDLSPEERLERLEQALRRHHFDPVDALPAFASLLGIELPRHHGSRPAPQDLREQTFDAVISLLERHSDQQPTLVAVEDLHWADPSTLEILDRLVDRASACRLLTLVTTRGDLVPPWSSRATLHLRLERLASPELRSLVEAVAGAPVPEGVLQQIGAKTDGVPLFAEEFTKMLLETGALIKGDGGYAATDRLEELTIPSTLHELVMARLDRSGEAKEVAQVASVMGRSFSPTLLRRVSDMDASTVDVGLARLIDVGLVWQKSESPGAGYSFKHALVQEAAYGSLLRRPRREFHERIALALIDDPQEAGEPEVIARHFTEAELAAPAIEYWVKATKSAMQRSAQIEAVSHVENALGLVSTLPPAERTQQELTVQLARATALTGLKGYGAREVELAYNRARELCEHLERRAELFPAMFGLLAYYLMHGRFDVAEELGRSLTDIARQADDTGLLLVSNFTNGMTLFYEGYPTRAVSCFEQGVELYDPSRHSSLAADYVFDPGVGCLRSGGVALWLLGDIERSSMFARKAKVLAERAGHSYGTTAVHVFGAILHYCRGEPKLVLKRADDALRLSTEHNFALWLGWASILRAWALMRATPAGEERDAQLEELIAGVEAYQASASQLFAPLWLCLLAEGYGCVGDVGGAIERLDEALVVLENTGERWWEAEILRLHGELQAALPQPDVAAAIDALRRSLEVARRQQARSLELRTATSLASLLTENDRPDEAREVVLATYGDLSAAPPYGPGGGGPLARALGAGG